MGAGHMEYVEVRRSWFHGPPFAGRARVKGRNTLYGIRP